MFTVLWLACSGPTNEFPTDRDAQERVARDLAVRHGATLAGVGDRLARVLATLPSLPGDRFFCRIVDKVTVKGKNKAVVIYEPLVEGEPDAIVHRLIEVIDHVDRCNDQSGG